MGLTPRADEHAVAHEVGHYMHHMLVGDARYLVIEDLAPTGHGLGQIHADRRTITEDIAYFGQFLLRGGVNSSDPTEPGMLIPGVRPWMADAPSAEGMACCLLARMHSVDPPSATSTTPPTADGARGGMTSRTCSR